MTFSRDDVARQFDSATFARGAAYAREGRVSDLHIDVARIDGIVVGSGRSIYRQSIRLVEGRAGVGFKGDCTCPMTHNCKHVVAVLLARLDPANWEEDEDDEDDEEDGGGFGLELDATLWLAQLESVQAALQAQAQAQAQTQAHTQTPARSPVSRLMCVLIPNPQDGTQQLHLCKARLRKDGSVGGATIHNGAANLLIAKPSWIRPDDEETIRLVGALRNWDAYQDDEVPKGRLGARVLAQLCAEGRLLWAGTRANLARGGLVPLRPGPPRRATLDWHSGGVDDEMVTLGWRFDDGKAGARLCPTEPLSYIDIDSAVDHGVLGELAIPDALAAVPPAMLLQLVGNAPAFYQEDRAAIAASLARRGLDRIIPAPLALETQERRDVVPVPHLLLDCSLERYRGETVRTDYAAPSFDYDGLSTAETDDPVLRRMDGNTVLLIVRDPVAEQAAAATLAALGFSRPDADSPLHEFPDMLVLPSPDDWLAFVRRDLPQLQAAGWHIEFESDYRYELTAIDDWYADIEEDGEGGSAWFELELGIVVDGVRHPLLPLLLDMIRKAPREFDAAALARRDDDAEMLLALSPTTRVALPWGRIKPILATLGELYFSERLGAKLRLPFTDAARLAELERAARLRWLGGERLRELGRKLDAFDGVRDVAVPAGLQAQLRPYQLRGLAWMQFLREYDFGGILADDMGLGKTVQTLAHILAEKEAGRLDAPALVVAPTTLMSNWQAEAARFAPGLRVLLLHGKDRKGSFDTIDGADLVLTTYALLGRDEAALRAHRYHLLILDEAQYVKNSKAKAAQVVRLLLARHRLCLTGTPVQNHLGELWSQFHFLMPGLLGDEKTFNATFRKPIEGQGDDARKNFLVRRLKPFMLRRTKDKVATELPPKTEIVLPVDFAGAQRDLYETVRVAMDKKVRDEIDRKGLARSQIVILEALLKLRQVCCDPRLLHAGSEAASGKLVALLDLLDSLLSEGRKVLVFSQFTSMLALIEAELQARGVAYALLTGTTVDRDAPVAAFQQGQVQVFLISLKAGGVGLNLTAADTVIHYDPWWNPATENQATDRAWRIGQEQPVFVYKLIARGTLEEKIQALQRRKGDLAQALLADGAQVGAGLQAADLQVIFAPLGEG